MTLVVRRADLRGLRPAFDLRKTDRVLLDR
jgi:hypothetical protein